MVLNKESAECLVFKRLGNEHMKWADTSKISLRVIVFLSVVAVSKPLRRLRSEIHPSHKLRLCSGSISSLQEALSPGTGGEFVNGYPKVSTHKSAERGNAYCQDTHLFRFRN